MVAYPAADESWRCPRCGREYDVYEPPYTAMRLPRYVLLLVDERGRWRYCKLCVRLFGQS